MRPPLRKNGVDYLKMKNRDSLKKIETFFSGKSLLLIMPAIAVFLAIILYLMPGNEIPEGGANLRALRVENFPIVLILEQSQGEVKSAWLRTPAGVKQIEQLEGLSYVSESTFLSKVDQDDKDDLLWRTSFTNFEGNGVHLWVGVTSWSPKAHIYITPYEYTRWDAVPAKLLVPKGTAVYVSPAVPTYNQTDSYRGRDSYSFIYTIRMTTEGPAFVPVPDIYKQLSILLKAGIQGEFTPTKRMAYVRMLNEFNSLAQGKPPKAETLLNFQMEKIAVLSWKR